MTAKVIQLFPNAPKPSAPPVKTRNSYILPVRERISQQDILSYLESDPLATVAEAKRAIVRARKAEDCPRCENRGFAGLPPKQQSLITTLARFQGVIQNADATPLCPNCGRR